jgi:hypothetical protein
MINENLRNNAVIKYRQKVARDKQDREYDTITQSRAFMDRFIAIFGQTASFRDLDKNTIEYAHETFTLDKGNIVAIYNCAICGEPHYYKTDTYEDFGHFLVESNENTLICTKPKEPEQTTEEQILSVLHEILDQLKTLNVNAEGIPSVQPPTNFHPSKR